jgi:hypothetical protein
MLHFDPVEQNDQLHQPVQEHLCPQEAYGPRVTIELEHRNVCLTWLSGPINRTMNHF